MNNVIIIAEAGVNHNGNYERALELIDKAAEAGADYVKFQTFKAEKIVNKSVIKAEYQINNMAEDTDNSQYNMLKKLEMPEQWHYDLKIYAEKKGIKFLSTGFDEDSINFLDQLGMPFYKIPSGEITHKKYLELIASKGKEIIISTGMASISDIRNCINVFIQNGITKDMITVLHCNTEYPTPIHDVNLLAMKTIGKEFDVKIGYSDHTEGIEVPIAAVALGAVVIEKHFTLDKNLPGPDHKASLNPNELKEMVRTIRNIEKALGDGQKIPSPSEKKNITIARKSLHFYKDLNEGHILSTDDFIALRPGSGISPMEIDNFIGKKLIKTVKQYQIVASTDIS
jgi:N-acetylneuraminate synthase/N,N'-diacetyllegionaminate synthase